MLTEKEIEDYGVIRLFSDYGKHQITIELRGDATIFEVGTALKAFLSATGFSASLIDEILEVPE
jgi:hypothetical protein